MMLFVFSIALSIILTFLLLKAIVSSTNTLPPGPIGLPYIGNLHQYDTSTPPHLYFWELSKRYGKIFSLKLGSTTMVVVSSAQLAKEVLKTQDLTFCSRPSLICQQRLAYNGNDIAFAPYNDYWREMRKICVLQLFSLKKVQSFIPIREDEVARVINKISQQAAKSSQIINLSSMVLSLTSTIICRVAFGIRFDEEAHERKRFDELFNETQALMAGFFFSDYFPFLGWLDKLSGQINRMEKNFRESDEFYEELIEKHLNPNRPKSMEGDVIDHLLQLKKDQSTSVDLTFENIKAVLMNIFIGGSDTVATVAVWAMTALMQNPRAMREVQEEVRKSVGKKGMVNESDIQNMPYLNAVIKETVRLYPPAPTLMARESMQNSILQGYKIPPKTVVQINYWAIARDPEYWKNPEEFIPERFLNSNMDFKGQDFELIPFGAGRRRCPGLMLGVATVELILSNLLYAFDWDLPCGKKIQDIDTDVLPGLSMHKRNPLCLIPKTYL